MEILLSGQNFDILFSTFLDLSRPTESIKAIFIKKILETIESMVAAFGI